MINKKIQLRESLAGLCEQYRLQGKTIGFTSGAFDILHAGHVDYLEKAKAICDVLIVGVNTDESVRLYKGTDRPVIPEQQRVKVIAALEMVDHVFLFSERRNKQNIEALKPDFYIKAGDYRPDELTSAEALKSYGGEVRIIPVKEAFSTSMILQRLSGPAEKFVEKEGAGYFERKPQKQAPAVFLDRDGTINEEILYLHEPERFRLTPMALEGIHQFQDMGYRIVIITNQPGIGFGYYSEEEFYSVNRKMLSLLSGAGIKIDRIYFCPHTKAEGCDCRKPGQALINRARDSLNLDLERSFFIGDRTSDIEAGRRAGMKTILVATGARGEDGAYEAKPDFRAENLLEAAKWVLKTEQDEKKT